MFYRFAADTLVIIHFLFILFVLLGGLLVLWKKWILPAHLLAVVWGALIEFLRWGCPLTPLENKMRVLSGQSGYPGGFIEHYLIPIVYPAHITPVVQFILGMSVIVVNVVIYFFIVKRIRKRKQAIAKGN